jgi:hypothetical protein
MRLPIWFPTFGAGGGGNNAAVQRGAPTPNDAYGIAAAPVAGIATMPVAIEPTLGARGVPWYTGENNYARQTGSPPGQPAWSVRQPRNWLTPPNPTGGYHVLPRYDWGAAGFGYIPGQITTNPIGAGIVAMNRAGTATRPPGGVAQVANKTFIFYNQQTINWGIQPGTSPLYPPEILAQLLGPLGAAAALPPIPGA